MIKKAKISVAVGGLFILGLLVVNPTVFADSKAKLAHLVMEHESKIASLEQIVSSLALDDEGVSSEDKISDEVKTALTKEAELLLPRTTAFWNEEIGDTDKINVTDVNVLDSNGDAVVQIYIEGDYGWKEDERGIFEPGRFLAYNFINDFNVKADMYGVDVNYEFYQNGERVTASDMMP
jgi:hypothetical protein